MINIRLIVVVGVIALTEMGFALRNAPAETTQLLDVKSQLVRKKRYIFFTTGSAVQCTMSITKSIVAVHPRGVAMLGEVDLFYPLQTKLADWFPTTRKPRPRPAAVAPQPKVDQSHAVVYSDSYPTVDRYYASQRPTDYWNRPQSHHTMFDATANRRPSYSNYNNRSSALYPSTYDSYYYPRRPTNTRADSTSPSLRRRPNINRRKSIPPSTERPIYYSEWKHERGYRQRRDIYTQFERVAANHGFDIRACLLRLICETRHYLLPQGKSFFHDAMRILFYVPVHQGDTYSDAMHSKAEDCATAYRKECRFSFLGLLLHPDKHSFG